MTNEDRTKGKKAKAKKAKGNKVALGGHHVHDGFFKQVMLHPGHALQFLRDHLPEGLRALLGPKPPEFLPGSFVNDLDQTHTDLLLKVFLLDGSPMLFHVIFEHKSYPDAFARVQLAGYIVDVLKRWSQEHPNDPPPPILPVLVYNGSTPWDISTQLADVSGDVPDEVRKHMLSLEHILVDLTTIADDDLSEDPHFRITLSVLKHGTDRAYLNRHLDELLLALFSIPVLARAGAIVYLMARVGEETVKASMQRNNVQDPLWQVVEPYYQVAL